MKTTKISNSISRKYVQGCEVFKANNLWSEYSAVGRYVVYSYARHWPLFIYDMQTNKWFENNSKYSVTTSKHKTQSHPLTDTIKLHVDDMIKVASNGVVALIPPLHTV